MDPGPDTGRERAIDMVETILDERGATAPSLGEIANRMGLPISTLVRWFGNQEALFEAVAERWFRPKVAVMEAVVASDLPPRRKLYEFYARRYVLIRDAYMADPERLRTYAEIGNQHYDAVRSYVDLGDHYLCEIIAEAMAEGHFPGLSIDEALSLINQMLAAYVNIALMVIVMDRLSEVKLARIVDTVIDGLSGEDRGAQGVTGLRAA